MKTLFKICVAVLFICSCSKAKTSQLIIETENGDIVYNIETASEVKELEIGLMNRDTLAPDGGMLFDLSKVPNKVTAMWMKDTKLSLDMMFLTKEGVIYWIKENAQPYSEELIIAPFPAAAVLEVNAGDVAKHNIKIGERVKHSLFKQLSHEETTKAATQEETQAASEEESEENTAAEAEDETVVEETIVEETVTEDTSAAE